MKRINLSLENSTYEKLRQKAFASKTTIPELVRKAIYKQSDPSWDLITTDEDRKAASKPKVTITTDATEDLSQSFNPTPKRGKRKK